MAFSGSIEGEHIVYAAPDHPEYKSYAIKDFLVVETETSFEDRERKHARGAGKVKYGGLIEFELIETVVQLREANTESAVS